MSVKKTPASAGKPVKSYASSHEPVSQCVLCSNEKHPLYVCPKFKPLSYDQRVAVLKNNNLCMNCLSSGHFVKQCKYVYKCRKFQ